MLAFLLILFSFAAFAQTTGSVTGKVTDPLGATVPDAVVSIANSLTGFERSTRTQSDGTFLLTNLPQQGYTLTVTQPGFETARQSVTLRSNIPVELTIALQVAGQNTEVQVTVGGPNVLVDPEATGTRTELNAAAIERLPTAPGNRGIEAALLSFPGFAADANGAIHPRGAHNQMTFVIDGMPVTDQLTGAFANAIDPAIVQTLDLYTGNIPAEFGSKVSAVAEITTRTGIGSGRRFTGSIQLGAAQFDTFSQVTQFSGGGDRWGYFGSFHTMKSNRYLDQVSRSNLHNGGNSERGFTRFDLLTSPADRLRVSIMAGRSDFQLANLRSQHASGQDQRQQLRDISLSVGWLRTLNARSTVDVIASYRTAVSQLAPSAGDTPVTAAQARHLTTINLGTRYNAVISRHTIRVGGDWQRFPVSENFSVGVTDPSFNDPASPDFIPSLLPFDLTRGGRRFVFSKKRTGGLYSGFLQDNIKAGRFTLSLGARYDNYQFLVQGNQVQPRVGLSFSLPETGTVLRLSYNRTYQTPPNENLLVSSSEESSVLVPTAVRNALGGAFEQVRPERQNFYEVGMQQAIARVASLNLSLYHKDSTDLQDNDNFLNTGIIFPTSLKQARVNGAEMRLTVLPWHRLSGSLSLTHYHAVVTPPFTGGLFLGSAAVNALTSGPFIIDHDQTLGAHGVVQYSPHRSVWISGALRYDSGLVAAQTTLADVLPDPDYADLAQYVNFDANPVRVRPRWLLDISAGYERRKQDRRQWDVLIQIANVTNTVALFNFQSPFVGTRLVQPRTAGIKWRWFF